MSEEITRSVDAPDPDPNRIKEKFDDYIETLDDLIENSESNVEAITQQKDAAANVTVQERTARDRTKDHKEEYININDYISQPINKKAEILTQNATSAKAVGATLETTLSNAVKEIKKIETKVAELKSAFCELDNAIKNRCEQSTLTKLRKIMYDGENVEQIVERLSKDVDDMQLEASAATGDAVKASSILAIIDLNDLVSKGEDVKSKVTGFKTDVDANLVFSQESLTQKQTQLETALADEHMKVDALAVAQAELDSLIATKDSIYRLGNFGNIPGTDDMKEVIEDVNQCITPPNTEKNDKK